MVHGASPYSVPWACRPADRRRTSPLIRRRPTGVIRVVLLVCSSLQSSIEPIVANGCTCSKSAAKPPVLVERLTILDQPTIPVAGLVPATHVFAKRSVKRKKAIPRYPVAWLDPATHVFPRIEFGWLEDVDGRDKPGRGGFFCGKGRAKAPKTRNRTAVEQVRPRGEHQTLCTRLQHYRIALAKR